MNSLMKSQSRDIVLAFGLSILIHAAFLLLSGRVQFGGLGGLEQSVQRAFQVRILPEEEARRLRQPRPDIEAEHQRRVRERIRESLGSSPELPPPPALSPEGNLEEALEQALEESLRQKRLDEAQAAQLPEVLAQSVDSQLAVDVLTMGRDVGREEPGIRRRRLGPLDEAAPEGLGQAQDAMSTLVASRTGVPRFAAAPTEAPPSETGPRWRPGLLPPRPIMDLTRKVETPPEVPPLYITPDQEKVTPYISLDEFLTVELFVYHLPEDPRGYFMVRIRPNEKSLELPVMSKDLIFVLDASASMGQRTMAALRTGIKLGLSKLRPEDRFNVVGFKRTVARFRPELVPAEPGNIQEALRFVDGLEPSGRTDIYGSLEPISKQARGGDHPFIILLFSDGRPNVGVVNSRTIINNLTANVRPNTSVFAFGAGQPMNRYLLDLLSYRNKGFVRFASDFSSTVSQIAEMIEALSDPLLINLTGDYGNIRKEDIYPKTLPDLYRGGEILVYGRYGQEEKFSLRILGEARGQQKEYIIDLPFPEEDNGPDNLPQLWAFRKIYDLIGQMCQEGETPERLAEIQRISRLYDVRTPYYE